MATPTYTLIDSVTLASSASSVTFSSISATGKGDLVLQILAGCINDNGRQVIIRLNGDTGSNYSYVNMRGESGSALSNSATTNRLFAGTPQLPAANTWQMQMQLMDFSDSTKHTSTLTRVGNNTTGTYVTPGVHAIASRWANTAAVTSISIETSADSFSAGSSFFLYQLVSE